MNKRRLPQPKTVNAQVGAYVRAVQKGLRDHHVVSSGKGWAVKKVGANRASRIFPTQAEAIRYGRDVARDRKTELIVHARDGMIRERTSFASESRPPKA